MAANKIVDRKRLVPALQAHREKGRSIVFTNGCFDLIHVGHVRYLQSAKKEGDILVVGINSDASMQHIKGPKRPLVPEDQRAEVLAALACVDFVTIFDEADPGALIESLTPDVLVKGADWKADAIIGADTVRQHGGRVVRVDLTPGASTSGIINRIANRYGPDEGDAQ